MGQHPPPRYKVLASDITLTSYSQVFHLIQDGLHDQGLSIAFCNVHTVMTSRRDPRLREALATFDIAAPDGVPLVWALKILHRIEAERVHGPTFMRYAIGHGRAQDLRHFLLGATSETLGKLTRNIGSLYPGALVVGSHAPPFRQMVETEINGIVDEIRRSDAQLIWVGMGMPKQELLIHEISDRLPACVLLGVGAAFDLLAGIQPEAPERMKRSGLEWAFRLAHEPGRLWRRYLVNNPYFLILLGRDLLLSRLRGIRTRAS